MRGATAEIWSTVHAARRSLVTDLSGLRDEQWSAQSLCPGWDVHDVLAHLVDLVEAIVHGEDIRRPLGLTGDYSGHAVAQALSFQARTPVSFGGGRERAAGLRLIDRQTGTTWGQGEDVEGDGVDLLLAVSGRPVAADQLSGNGAARLAADHRA